MKRRFKGGDIFGIKFKLLVIFLFLGVTDCYLVFSQVPSSVTSMTRETKPVITFRRIETLEEIPQGEILPLYLTFYIEGYIPRKLKLFLHLVDLKTGKLLVNADTDPPVPTDEWIPYEAIRLGPFGMYIPEDLPEGEYGIRCGFMEVKFEKKKKVYIREPYTNKDIKNFIVATVKVIKKKEVPPQELKPLFISDFSRSLDGNRWQCMGTTFVQVDSHALVTYYPGYPYPSFYMEDFFKDHPEFRDWSNYDLLVFAVYDEDSKKAKSPVNMTLQIKDSEGRRFKRWFSPSQDYGHPVEIDLADVALRINLYDIASLSFYMSELKEVRRIRLSSIQLKRRPQQKVFGYEPFITFKKLEVPSRVEQGTFFNATFIFSTAKVIKENYRLFIRFLDSNSQRRLLSLDTFPPQATSQWKVGTDVKVGPIRVVLPQDIPPGEYKIQAGFYTSIEVPEGALYVKHYKIGDVVFVEQPSRTPVDYIKIPYTNPEVENYILGKIEIVASKKTE